MSRTKGYIGARITLIIVALTVLMAGGVLVSIYLSQPIDPEIELGVHPVDRASVPGGYLQGLNLTPEEAQMVASLFNISASPQQRTTGWTFQEGNRILTLSTSGNIFFEDLGFRCNPSSSRDRSEFPDPVKISSLLMDELVSLKAFPNDTRSIMTVHEELDAVSGKVCRLGPEFRLYHNGLRLNSTINMSIDHDGSILNFESGVFSIVDSGIIEIKTNADEAVRHLARSMAHNSWDTKRYVSRLLVENISLEYTYPSTGYRVDVLYLIEFRAIYNTGDEEAGSACVLAS